MKDKTDFESVIEWLENNTIDYQFGRSDMNTRSWIVTDLPLDIMSNFGEDKNKINVTFQFDFLSGEEGDDDIFGINVLDIIYFRCDRLDLYNGYMTIWDQKDGRKIYLSA